MAVLAATAVVACDSTAQGASVRYDASQQRILYVAAPGEVNDLTVSEAAGQYVFTDAAGVAIADGDEIGGPCGTDLVNLSVARCPATGVELISVAVLDGDDVVHIGVAVPKWTIITGGSGYDRLYGGAGADRLSGGPGADLLSGANGPDVLDTGVAGLDPDNPLCLNELEELIIPLCQDFASGGAGFDTISYETRAFPVYVDTRSWTTYKGTGSIAVDDPDGTCMTTPNPAIDRPECQLDYFTGADQTGSDFIERIVGGRGDDELIGSKYDNTLIGGPGADTLCGGQGVDTADYSDKGATGVTVSLDGNPAMPTDPESALGGSAGARARIDCRTAEKDMVLNTSIPQPPGPAAPRDCVANDGAAGEGDCVGEDVENVTGGAGDDVLIGGDPDQDVNEGPNLEPRGANVLNGRGGEDLLDGGLGPDVLEGGGGSDTVTYEGRSEGVSATIDGFGNDGSATATALDHTGGTTGDFNPFNGRADDISPDVENIIGGAGDDTLGGDAGPNRLTGGGGEDDISGGDGADTIDGGAADDTVKGEDGNDTITAGAGNDSLDGGAGNDSLDGGDGDDDLHGGLGADLLFGGLGNDLLDYSDATAGVSVTLNGAPDDGTAGEGDNAGSDIEGANGGLGDDTLMLGAGDGFIDAGAGNDRVDGGPGADSIHGGAGLDTVDYSSRVNPLSVDVNSPGSDGEAGEDDDVFDDVETILGGAGGDLLVGGGAASVLMGNAGDDRLYGTGGDDQLYGGPGADALDGGNANDTLDGGDANDALSGQTGDDTLMGGGGDDLLDGGPGRDSLGGGAGADQALYAGRTRPLTLTFGGNSINGESGENDVIKLDVEGLIGGAADDLINSKNGVKNFVTCGPGSDQIAADTFDDIAGDCERIINTNPCKPSPQPATMSSSGVVTIRVSCTEDARGSLLLQTYRPVKQLKKARKKARRSTHLRAKRVTLGRGSFKLKRGQNTKVKVRIGGSGKRVIKRSRKGIDARAILTVRQSFGVRALSLKNGRKLKIKAKP